MSKKRVNRHRGSSLDEFLEEEGLLEEATAKAVKKALVWQLTRAMEEQRMTKTMRAAEILGLRVQIELVAA
jgi:hypothetical protein